MHFYRSLRNNSRQRPESTLQVSMAAISTLILALTAQPSPGRTPEGLPPDQRKVVTWAEDRFELAGLDLPPVEYVFHDTSTSCASRRGLFHPEANVVEICGFEADTLIHELAHAWAETALDDAAKDAFLSLRGLESWNAASVEWELRGAEHAAEVIAWGVEERTRLVPSADPSGCVTPRLLTIPDSSPHQLAMAYTMLTGRPPSLRDASEWDSLGTEALSPEAIRQGVTPVTSTPTAICAGASEAERLQQERR